MLVMRMSMSMMIECPNPNCKRKPWDYTGKKRFPAYIACPDCLRRIKLPDVPDEPVDSAKV